MNLKLINSIQNILVLIVLTICVQTSFADVGQTHNYKIERAQLLLQVEDLKTDSTNKATEILALQEQIISIDKKIFDSYDETVDRVIAQKLNQGSNDRMVIYLALGASLLALFFAIIVFVVRTKVMGNGYSGLFQFYREMTLDFAGKVSAEKTTNNRMLRVNIVVLIGLIIMSVSVISFLVKTL